MSEPKDYTSADDATGNTHYNGVPSSYGKRVEDQVKRQSDYCNPGAPDGEMRDKRRDQQSGP